MNDLHYFTYKDVMQLDNHLMSNCHLSMDQLIERAGYLIYRWLYDHHFNQPMCFFIGPGNNGKDALVAARYLVSCHQDVTIYAPFDTLIHSNYYQQLHCIEGVKFVHELPNKLNHHTVLIDALFGVGINREFDSTIATIIHTMNSFNGVVVSIDIPSGLFEDRDSLSVHANTTLTMMVPKQVFTQTNKRSIFGDVYLLNFRLPLCYFNNTVHFQPKDYYLL